jgi:hypothetical protein
MNKKGCAIFLLAQPFLSASHLTQFPPPDAILTFGLLTAPHANSVEKNAEVAKLADALA